MCLVVTALHPKPFGFLSVCCQHLALPLACVAMAEKVEPQPAQATATWQQSVSAHDAPIPMLILPLCLSCWGCEAEEGQEPALEILTILELVYTGMDWDKVRTDEALCVGLPYSILAQPCRV